MRGLMNKNDNEKRLGNAMQLKALIGSAGQPVTLHGVKSDFDCDIKGLAYHSGRVKSGDMFVCIKGYKTDGHRYLKQAVASGAVAAIVESFQPDVDIPQYEVKDSRAALSALAAAFYAYPSKKMKMIGITATNGKTTTSYMTNSILEGSGLKTGLVGTVVIKIDDKSIASELTTPESLDLQHYLAEMASVGVSHVTMEVSSSALELKRVNDVTYDIVALNNISREHIDTHGSFEKYFGFKSSLITNASEKAYAVLNLDDAYSASLIKKTKARVVTFSVKGNAADLCCENLDLTTGRGRFDVRLTRALDGIAEPMTFHVDLSVPGLHSVYNAMSAIAIALLNGIGVEDIQAGLKGFKGVERRFEFIFENGFIIVDDHFANAGNIDVTLNTLDFMQYKDLQLVYAVRGSRGPTVNRENAEAIEKWAKKLGFNKVIATKSVESVTEKDEVLEDELRVFMEVMDRAGISVTLYDTLKEAVASGVDAAEPGDLVLLAGCQGMDFGAEAALRHLAETHPEYDKKTLFAPLKTRVAGITDRNF